MHSRQTHTPEDKSFHVQRQTDVTNAYVHTRNNYNALVRAYKCRKMSVYAWSKQSEKEEKEEEKN